MKAGRGTTKAVSISHRLVKGRRCSASVLNIPQSLLKACRGPITDVRIPQRFVKVCKFWKCSQRPQEASNPLVEVLQAKLASRRKGSRKLREDLRAHLTSSSLKKTRTGSASAVNVQQSLVMDGRDNANTVCCKNSLRLVVVLQAKLAFRDSSRRLNGGSASALIAFCNSCSRLADVLEDQLYHPVLAREGW